MATESSASAGSTASTPAGRPARKASSAQASALRGVCSAGFTQTVQPAANAGASLRVIIASGKFQGVIATQTPTGCCQTQARLAGSGDGMVSPATRRPSSAYQSRKLAA